MAMQGKISFIEFTFSEKAILLAKLNNLSYKFKKKPATQPYVPGFFSSIKNKGIVILLYRNSITLHWVSTVV